MLGPGVPANTCDVGWPAGVIDMEWALTIGACEEVKTLHLRGAAGQRRVPFVQRYRNDLANNASVYGRAAIQLLSSNHFFLILVNKPTLP